MQILLRVLVALTLLAPIVVLAGNIQRSPHMGLRDRFTLFSHSLGIDVGVITLADAQVNAQDDIEFAVIDETRRMSWLLDQLTFDDSVNPSGGGATLTYGYTRLVTARSGAFREFNSEYVPGEAVRSRQTVDLKPLGGSFNIDRVLAHLGPAATDEEAFQFSQLILGVQTSFQTAMIQGDADIDGGFDGLDKALSGSVTEIGVGSVADWTGATIADDRGKANDALDLLDQLVHLVVGGADAILTNLQGAARVRSLARRAGYYTRAEDALGREIERFGNTAIIDLGFDNDGVSPIIPVAKRTADASTYTLVIAGTPTGGTFTLSVTVDHVTQTTAPIAFNANATAVHDAIVALDGIDTGDVTVTGTTTKTISFVGDLLEETVGLAGDGALLTGGSGMAATVTNVGSATVTDLYAVKFGLTDFHAVSTTGKLVNVYRPNYALPGAVKTGEVEMGPLAGVLKRTRGAAVLRNVQVQ